MQQCDTVSCCQLHLKSLSLCLKFCPVNVSSVCFYLHKEAGAERPADVDVVIPAGELSAATGQVKTIHDPGQLLPHVVSRHQ